MAEPRRSLREMSREAYLEFERPADVKHEWYRGEVFALAGAHRDHVVIVSNLVHPFGRNVPDDCMALASDMRVWIDAARLYTYPDVVGVCGKERYEDEAQTTLLNPTLIVKVLSESTEAYDRGRKFKLYRSVSSPREVAFVAQDWTSIDLYRKEEGRWMVVETPGDTVEFRPVGVTVSIDDIYRRVDVSDHPPSAPTHP